MATVPFGRWDAAFAVVALGSGALLLYLGRSFTFWLDEWRFIQFDGGLTDYFRPHFEHWSTFPLALYRATFSVVHLRSYLPYLGELIALHVVAVTGVFLLVRMRLGPLLALLVAFPLLLLGVGSDNLFWAFQTGFVGSVMFGVWALFFVERPGRRSAVAAAGLLVGCVASSGMGLFFLVAVFGRALADTTFRRRAIGCVAPSAAAYTAWYATVGHEPVGEIGPVASPWGAAEFAVRGLGHAAVAMLGLDLVPAALVVGLLAFGALVGVTAFGLVRGRGVGLAAGCLAAVVAMYLTIGFARAEWEGDHTTLGRYTYVAAFFLVLALVDCLRGREVLRVDGTGWASLGAAVLVALYASCVAANLDGIRSGYGQFRYTSDVTRAYFGLAQTRGDEGWIDRQARFNFMPSVSQIPAVVARDGFVIRPDELGSTRDRKAYEQAVLLLVGTGFHIERAATRTGTPRRLNVVDVEHAAVSNAGCVRIRGTDRDATVAVLAPGGSRLSVASNQRVQGRVGLGYQHGPLRFLQLATAPGDPVDVVIPEAAGDARRWLVGFELRGLTGETTLCLYRTAP
jgi:hypothetical protein